MEERQVIAADLLLDDSEVEPGAAIGPLDVESGEFKHRQLIGAVAR